MKAKNKKNAYKETKSVGIKSYAFLVFGIVFLFYFHTKNFGLSNFDDDTIIPKIEEALSNGNCFYTAITTDALLRHTEPFYRPLQNISYLIDLKISGISETWMLHLSNVICFSLIGVALFLLLIQLKIPRKLAFFSTLIFSFHPLLVSSVAWIPARGDLFVTLFSILSFIYFIKFLENKNYRSILYTSIFFILALFGKETAAFLPFAFLFYFLLNRPVKIEYKHILLAALLVVFGLFWFLIRDSIVAKELNETTFSNSFLDVLSNIQFIPTGLSLFFFPSDFTTIPSYTFYKLGFGTLVFGFLIYLVFKKSEQTVMRRLFYLSWYILFLIPAFFIKQKFFDYLDHRFLLPSIGILLLLISSIPSKYISKGDIQNPTPFIILIVILASLSYIKASPYKSPMDFCNASITEEYKQAVALNNRATIKHNGMEFESALEDYMQALEIDSNYVLAYVNRGGTKFMLKDYAGALEDFNQDIKRNKYPINTYYFRALCYANLGKFDKAIEDMKFHISKNGNDKFAYFHMGRILSVMRKPKEAIESFSNAIQIDPGFCEAYSERASVKYRLGDFEGTLADCNSALQINSSEELALQIKSQTESLKGKVSFGN